MNHASLPLPSMVERISPPNLQRWRVVGLTFWTMLVLAQAFIWPTLVNLLCAALTITGGWLGVTYSVRRSVLLRAPLSTTIVFGYTLYYFLLPPVATLAEAKPMTFNLLHPWLTSVHSLAALCAIILAHTIYCRIGALQQLRQTITHRFYKPFRLFSPISNKQLFVMGVMGLAAMAHQIFIAGTGQQEVLGAGNKFLQALYPLAYLPYLMLVGRMTTLKERITKEWMIALVIHTCLLLLVAMGRNARSAFFMGLASVVICYGYGVATGVISRKWLKAKTLVPSALLLILLSGAITDLATAMVVVRGQRTEIGAAELIKQTAITFFDKEALRKQREIDEWRSSEWDERYLDNLFLARMANLKYTDNAIGLASDILESGDDFFKRMEWQRALLVFPRPILSIIAPSVDKSYLGNMSGGDLMLYAATGNPYVLGGFRTGSLLGHSWALFGWGYLLVIGIVLLPVFMLIDAQSTSPRKEEGKGVILAPIAMVSMFSWFFFLTSAATGVESFAELPAYLLRGWIQIAVIWFVVYLVTKPLASLSVAKK